MVLVGDDCILSGGGLTQHIQYLSISVFQDLLQSLSHSHFQTREEAARNLQLEAATGAAFCFGDQKRKQRS